MGSFIKQQQRLKWFSTTFWAQYFGTSVGQRQAGSSIGAGVARATLGRGHGAAGGGAHHVFQYCVGVALGPERELLAIQDQGLHATPEAGADGGAAPLPGAVPDGVVAGVAPEKDHVVQVEGAEAARGGARGGVELVQDQLGVVPVDLQGNRVPHAVVKLNAMHGYQAWTTATVKPVLEPTILHLQRGSRTWRHPPNIITWYVPFIHKYYIYR